MAEHPSKHGLKTEERGLLCCPSAEDWKEGNTIMDWCAWEPHSSSEGREMNSRTHWVCSICSICDAFLWLHVSVSGFGQCPVSSWTSRAVERMKQLQECLRTGLYVWCGRWEKASRSPNRFLWQTSRIFCTYSLLLVAFCCRSTIKRKPVWRHWDQQPLSGEEMCLDLPSIPHLFCTWDSH